MHHSQYNGHYFWGSTNWWYKCYTILCSCFLPSVCPSLSIYLHLISICTHTLNTSLTNDWLVNEEQMFHSLDKASVNLFERVHFRTLGFIVLNFPTRGLLLLVVAVGMILGLNDSQLLTPPTLDPCLFSLLNNLHILARDSLRDLK